MTRRYLNRADSPVRTLSDQVSERIAAAMAGRKPADVVPLECATQPLIRPLKAETRVRFP